MQRLFKKTLRDLFGNKSRLFTALLAIVLGSVVFGSITFVNAVLRKEIITVFDDTNPASGILMVDRVDDGLMELTKNFAGITDFEVKAAYELRMEKPNGTNKALLLFSAPDYENMHINTLRHIDGAALPGVGEALLEADCLGVADTEIGGTVPIRLPDGSACDFTVSGTLNDLSQHPPSYHNSVYAYVSETTLLDMGLSMNRIDYLVSGESYDRDNILQVSTDYIHLLEENGYQVLKIEISATPGVSMHLEEFAGALFIFQFFSILAFLFGCVIMSSLFSTLLAGQVRQIGILKSIGGKTAHIGLAYMGAAAVLIFLNLVISFPLSVLLGRILSYFFLRLGNMYLTSFAVPGYLYLIFIGVTLLVPLVLACLPIRRGMSVSVKKALNDHAIQNRSNQKPVSITLRLPRPLILSLRSATGHRRRFLMNVSMLTLGGLLFVGIMGTIVSINTALADNMKARHFDFQFTTSNYDDTIEIHKAMSDIPQIVDSYEVWGETTGKLIYENGTTGNLYAMTAMDYDTPMFVPEIMEGRWLEAGDTNAIVVSFEFLNAEGAYALGDTVSFQLAGIIQDLTIVGVIKEIGSPSIYLEHTGFENLVPTGARRASVAIATVPRQGSMRMVYKDLDEYFTHSNVPIVQSESKTDRYNVLTSHFTTTLVSFLIVAIMAVCVAGFGLASTMNLQVAERTREIGIMKSMGAGDKRIRSLVRAESTFVCLSSWAVSLVLAVPVLILGIHYIGVYVLEIPLKLSGSAVVISMLVWLAFTWLVGRFASRTSGNRAAKMTVRAAFAHE